MRNPLNIVSSFSRKLKLKFSVVVILLFVLSGYLLTLNPAIQTQLCTWELSNTQDETKLQKWMNCVVRINADAELADLQSRNEIVNFITKYIDLYPQTGVIKPAQISVVLDIPQSKDVTFETFKQLDPEFLSGQSYISVAGQNGKDTYHSVVLSINGQHTATLELMHKLSPEVVNQISFDGQKSQADVEAEVVTNFAALKQAIKDNDVVHFSEVVKEGSTDLLAKLRATANITYKLDNATLGNLTLAVSDVPTEEYVQIGQYLVNQNNCHPKLKLVYGKEAHQYFFDDLFTTFNQLCNPAAAAPAIGTTEINLNCTNCWLAAVDKVYKLPANYAPSVVNTGLRGGGQLVPEAATAMTSMFQDAQTKGVSLQVVSSYRSYQTQITTFEYWVQTEIKKGYSRAQAEIRANVYSAKPGHSEHQLGTTADLSCAGCVAFDFSAGNNTAYSYLAQNAYRFGFAISYPQGTQLLTGYTYEPWHVRYIGVDLATELFKTGYLNNNGNYLAKFLRDKFGV